MKGRKEVKVTIYVRNRGIRPPGDQKTGFLWVIEMGVGDFSPF